MRHHIIPKIFEYWEVYACSTWNVIPDQLFTKTRKREVVYARDFCMVYMMNFKKYSSAESGAKYYKDHATVLHSEKKIKNLKETDKDFKEKHEEFLIRCKAKEEADANAFNIETDIESVDKAIYRLSIKFGNLMHSLKELKDGKSDEEQVIQDLILFGIDVNIVKKLFTK